MLEQKLLLPLLFLQQHQQMQQQIKQSLGKLGEALRKAATSSLGIPIDLHEAWGGPKVPEDPIALSASLPAGTGGRH